MSEACTRWILCRWKAAPWIAPRSSSRSWGPWKTIFPLGSPVRLHANWWEEISNGCLCFGFALFWGCGRKPQKTLESNPLFRSCWCLPTLCSLFLLKCPSLQNMTSTPKRNQLFHQGPLERQLGKRLTFYVDTLRVSENGFLHWFIGCVFPWVCSIGLELLPERGVTGK